MYVHQVLQNIHKYVSIWSYVKHMPPNRKCIRHADSKDDDGVTCLQATKACPKYAAVWARTRPLMLQPGSNLGQ